MDNNTLLSVENLKKYFKIRDKSGKKAMLRAVDGVSLNIERGEAMGLVGESGCGKTTLGRTILRLTEPDGGAIKYDGRDITRVNMRPYRSKMQIVFQNPAGCLDPRCRVRDVVAEGLLVNGSNYSKAERDEKVLSLLNSVGIDPESVDRYPHEFSGGQQQRIGIARALAVDPEFIVCDEPVSALDVSYQAQIINLLEELQGRLGLTYLFISHDLSVVRHMCNRIGVMYLGKLVEYGPCDEVVGNPAHPYTKALVDAVPVPDPKIARARTYKTLDEPADMTVPEGGCRYRNICDHATDVCRESEPESREISAGRTCACHML